MNNFKRFMMVLASIALVVASGILPVFAQNTVGTLIELQNAINSSTDGDVITLSSTFPVGGNIPITIPASNNITIDGDNVDLQNSMITVNGNSTGTTTLKNFVLSDGDGVGFNINSTAKIVLENIVVKNRTSNFVEGAALHLNGNANLEIKNSSFISNTSIASGYGGGAIGITDFKGTLTIENCYFYGNKTTNLGTAGYGGEGGAISINRMFSTAKLSIFDSYFDSNSAVENAPTAGTSSKLADGGALSIFNCLNGAIIDIKGSTFSNNIAGDDGGAILIQTNDIINSGITFTNNTFYKNESKAATSSSNNGGAIQIYANGSVLEGKNVVIRFDNNTFVANKANKRGGAIGFSGNLGNNSTGIFNNNLFVGNSSSTNGAVSLNPSSAEINNVGLGSTNLPLKDVFGEFDVLLNTTYSSTQVGHTDSRKPLPTIIISPVGVDSSGNYIDGKANDVIDVENNPSYNVNSIDQNKNDRSQIKQDAGSVEIGYVLFDANGGIFASENKQTSYDGTVYKIPNSSDEIIKIYKISTLNGNISKPSNPSLSGVNFLGWSETSNGTVLSETELSAITNGISGSKTLYAIYGSPVQKSNVIIKYVDESDVQIPGYPDVTITGDVGTAYDTTSYREIIPNYTRTLIVGSETGHFGNNTITVKYVYTRNQGTVTVQYQDTDGNLIGGYPPVTLTGNEGTAYDTTSKKATIPNYTYDRVIGDEQGIFTDGNITVIYVYTRNQTLGTVTVKYQDSDDNAIEGYPSIVLTGNPGSGYDTTLNKATIPNYTYDRVIGDEQGTFTDGNITVIYVYTRNQTQGTVTVKYQDSEGNPINGYPSVTLAGTTGTRYDTTSKKAPIPNYTYDRVIGDEQGTFTDGNITVIYVYSLNDGQVLVNFIDTNGKLIEGCKSLTISGKQGSTYDVSSNKLTIPGYKYLRTDGNVTGKFEEDTIVVNFVYEKETVVIKNGTVTVHYVDENDEHIIDSITLSGEIGSNYNTDQKVFEGYTFVKVEGKTSGSFSSDGVVVRYIYKKLNAPTLPASGINNNTFNYGLFMVLGGMALFVLGNLKNKNQEYIVLSGFKKVKKHFKNNN